MWFKKDLEGAALHPWTRAEPSLGLLLILGRMLDIPAAVQSHHLSPTFGQRESVITCCGLCVTSINIPSRGCD